MLMRSGMTITTHLKNTSKKGADGWRVAARENNNRLTGRHVQYRDGRKRPVGLQVIRRWARV
jgi:hypothetical protein